MTEPNTDISELIRVLIEEQRTTNQRLDRLARAVSELATEHTLKSIGEEVAATNRETNIRLDYILKSWSTRPERPLGVIS
jgi:hypothetical protein